MKIKSPHNNIIVMSEEPDLAYDSLGLIVKKTPSFGKVWIIACRRGLNEEGMTNSFI